MWLAGCLVVVALLVLLLVFLLKVCKATRFFRDRGFPEEPASLPLGISSSFMNVLRGNASILNMGDLVFQGREDAPYVGYYMFFGEAVLIVKDPELIKRILIKEFDSFHDRRPFRLDPEANFYLSKMLVNLSGQEWKTMRSLLTPAFTSGRLKQMLPTMMEVSEELENYLGQLSGGEVELKEASLRYTIDILASTGFGMQTNSFKDPDNKFKDMVDRIISRGKYERGAWGNFKMMLNFMLPTVAKFMKWSMLDWTAEDFFINILKTQILERRKMQGQKDARRCDFIDILISIFSEAEDTVHEVEAEDKMNVEEINETGTKAEPLMDKQKKKKKMDNISDKELLDLLASNALLFFFAGFETSSTALTACLYHLGENQEVQEKLYQEIEEAILENGGDTNLDYARLQSLEYLDAFIMESMRHFNISLLERQCTKAYTIPGTDLVIPKGMMVQIPVPYIMKDERYFADPEQFRPENFTADAKSTRSLNLVALGGFGLGPRNCIAMRFAILLLKAALCKVVHNHAILPSQRTQKLEPSSGSFNVIPKEGVWVEVKKRTF